MARKIYHRIKNAYDAYWFIYNHPRYIVYERSPRLEEEEATTLRNEGVRITEFECEDGSIYYQQEMYVTRHAIQDNLDISYAKVDDTGRINDNTSRNVNIECWLEFGEEQWTQSYRDIWFDEPTLIPCHDCDLDCGGATFDDALIILAKKIKKLYGDYK